jgi:hypothetical protein
MTIDELEEAAMRDLARLSAGMVQAFGAKHAAAMLLVTTHGVAEQHLGDASCVRAALDACDRNK